VHPGETNEFVYVNVASARTGGIEAAYGIRVLPNLRIEFAYALTATRDVGAKRRLPGRALHKGTLRASYRDPKIGLDLSARASIFGERRFYEDLDADGIAEIAKPYSTLDLRAEKRVC